MADEITLASLARAARNDDAQLDIQKAAETATLTFTEEERQQIDKIKGELDLRESVTAVEFGIGSQRKLAEFADLVLDNSTKDSTDIAGQLLRGSERFDMLGRESAKCFRELTLYIQAGTEQRAVQAAVESRHGIDTESLNKANESLVRVIEEALALNRESALQHRLAQAELGRIENQLQNALSQVR